MSVFQNINLPEINSASDMKKVKNYLAQMDENIRYAIENIDEENITKKFIDDLTVRNLYVTNGDNSILINPDDGFLMLKGTKKQFTFDINTGEATFGGKIVGGSIESENYTEIGDAVLAGMLIDLENGSIKSSGFSYEDGVFRVHSGYQQGDYTFNLRINSDEFSIEEWYLGRKTIYARFAQNSASFHYDIEEGITEHAIYSLSGIELKIASGLVLVANKDQFVYKGWRVITGDILNDFESDLKAWVTANFEPKAGV